MTDIFRCGTERKTGNAGKLAEGSSFVVLTYIHIQCDKQKCRYLYLDICPTCRNAQSAPLYSIYFVNVYQLHSSSMSIDSTNYVFAHQNLNFLRNILSNIEVYCMFDTIAVNVCVLIIQKYIE